MAGFRSNIKRLARRALCASLIVISSLLAAQHWAAAATSPSVTPSQPLADTASAGDLAAFSQASQQQPDPDRQGLPPPRDARQEDDCRFCAALATANAILFAPPPLLMLPQLLEFLYQATDAEFTHLKSIGLTDRRESPPAS
jgi:hypothetical protein